MGCLELILPGAGSGEGGGGPEGLGSRKAGVAGALSWVGVRISRLKRPLSQTPLRQGQSQGGLGPFRPPRTLRLPGLRDPATLAEPGFPRPPQPPLRCSWDLLAEKPWNGLPPARAAPSFRRPAIPRPCRRTGSRPRLSPHLRVGRHLEAALLPLPLPLTNFPSPFLPALYRSPSSLKEARWHPALLEDQARAIRLPPVGACRTQVRDRAGWGPQGAKGVE